MRYARFAVLFLAALVPCVVAHAIPAPWSGDPAWLRLEEGKKAYAGKDFGAALVAFDRAIGARRDSFSMAAAKLDQALATKAAKGAGGTISGALAAFATEDFIQRDYDAIVASAGPSTRRVLEAVRLERISDSHRAFIDVLLLVMEYRPFDSLEDSILKLRIAVETLSVYPEAEYWKGKVFMVEGELRLAEAQFTRALSMSASLDIPDERYTILYALADLYAAKSSFARWEGVMRTILADDPLTADKPADPFMRDAMLKALREAGFDKFMLLYRIEPSFSMRANASMADYLLERGRLEATLHAAVVANMILTRAAAMLAAKDWDYAWNGLADFRSRAAARADVAEYLEANDFDKALLVLADALYVDGSRTAAVQLWRSVAASGAEPYAAVATRRLSSPETAVRRGKS